MTSYFHVPTHVEVLAAKLTLESPKNPLHRLARSAVYALRRNKSSVLIRNLFKAIRGFLEADVLVNNRFVFQCAAVQVNLRRVIRTVHQIIQIVARHRRDRCTMQKIETCEIQ